MLGRATSMKRVASIPTPTATPPVVPSALPPVPEKALPMPSPDPIVTPALAVTPSPPLAEVVPSKSPRDGDEMPPPPPPQASPPAESLSGTQQDAATVPEIMNDARVSGQGMEKIAQAAPGVPVGAEAASEGQQTESPPPPVDKVQEQGSGDVAVEDTKSPNLDLDGPPPPTPPKSEDGEVGGKGQVPMIEPSVSPQLPNGVAGAVDQDQDGEKDTDDT